MMARVTWKYLCCPICDVSSSNGMYSIVGSALYPVCGYCFAKLQPRQALGKPPKRYVLATGFPPSYLEGWEGECRLGRLSAALEEKPRKRFWEWLVRFGQRPFVVGAVEGFIFAVIVSGFGLSLWRLFVRWCVES